MVLYGAGGGERGQRDGDGTGVGPVPYQPPAGFPCPVIRCPPRRADGVLWWIGT
jgi:hypothetical protein